MSEAGRATTQTSNNRMPRDERAAGDAGRANQATVMSLPTVDPDVRPDVDTTLDPTNPRDCAHIVDQRDPANDVTSAIVEGREVTALCGYRWIPYRDAKGRPVCEACVEAYGRITGS